MSEALPEEAKVLPRLIDAAQERKKPRLVTILFFDFSNETRERKLNLLGVFDRLFVAPETKKSHQFGIFLRIAQVYNDRVEVTIYGPTGDKMGDFGFDTSSEAEE